MSEAKIIAAMRAIATQRPDALFRVGICLESVGGSTWGRYTYQLSDQSVPDAENILFVTAYRQD